MKTILLVVGKVCHSPKAALFILLLLSISLVKSQAPDFEWAKQMGGVANAAGWAIAIDAAGNVYTAGGFVGTADFDPGSGTYNMTSAGSSDIFIAKMDAVGNLIWAKSMGGPGGDGVYALTLDAAGNIYTTGRFQGTADFDPGPGTYTLTAAGGDEIFISKLDASGNFVWAKALGGTGHDYGYSIAVDAVGNVYTIGTFQATADFDPGPGTYNYTSAGLNDIFISKLDASGDFVWAMAMGGTGYDYGSSIAVDAAGNVYTTGSFQGTVDFNPGSGSFNLTAMGSSDIFISKLDASGDLVWAKAIGGTGDDWGASMVLDAAGNIYTTGGFQGTVDFDPGAGTFNLTAVGGSDIFISKLDASGDFVWAKAMGGTGNAGANSIVLDPSGNVYSTGTFTGTVDFDPGPGTFTLTSAGSLDVFFSMLDASGNFVWAKAMGGPGIDRANAMVLDAAGSIYTTGYFEGTADFDPGPGIYNLTSAGNNDIFIHKMSHCLSTKVTLSITLDHWPMQTTWEVRDASNQVVYSGGPYPGMAGGTVNVALCLDDACYSFTIFDSGNDGICCKGKSKGSYSLTVAGTGAVLASGGSFGASETTNFCLQPAGQVCDVPTGIAVSNITASEATLSWNAATNAVSYNVRIRETGGLWNSDITTDAFYTYANLTACTGYEFEVETVCAEGMSGFSAAFAFSTIGCPPVSCAAPTGLFVSNINKKNARLNWGAVSGATQYEAQIWPQGTSNVNTYTTSGTNTMVNGLNVGTTYEWYVRANCSGSWSPYSVVHSFVAGSSSKWDDPNEARAAMFRVFPNPSTGTFTVQYNDGKERTFAVQVFDITGRVIYQSMQSGSALNMDIDLSAQAEGTYLVVVADGTVVLERTKVVLMGSR